MSIRTIPSGHRGPHVLADYLLTRPCAACGGEGQEKYFDGGLLRDERLAAKRSLRWMEAETGISRSQLSALERGIFDFDEDTARRYLSALGIL